MADVIAQTLRKLWLLESGLKIISKPPTSNNPSPDNGPNLSILCYSKLTRSETKGECIVLTEASNKSSVTKNIMLQRRQGYSEGFIRNRVLSFNCPPTSHGYIVDINVPQSHCRTRLCNSAFSPRFRLVIVKPDLTRYAYARFFAQGNSPQQASAARGDTTITPIWFSRL